jgi:hypothetical protein
MLNKKAELTTNEILEIILAAAGIIILVLLLYNLISPNFNKEEKTAESYFDSLKKAIEIADKGGTGTFSIWQPGGATNYYLIYFKEGISFKQGDLNFLSLGANTNHICLCYTSKENICTFCENLKYPVKFSETEDFSQFIIQKEQKINIIKSTDEDFYRFNLIK